MTESEQEAKIPWLGARTFLVRSQTCSFLIVRRLEIWLRKDYSNIVSETMLLRVEKC